MDSVPVRFDQRNYIYVRIGVITLDSSKGRLHRRYLQGSLNVS
jgi:hypothetical protein